MKTEHLLDTLIKHATLYSKDSGDEFWLNIKHLKRKGVSFRVLERALGIPKSTLRDKIKEGEPNE